MSAGEREGWGALLHEGRLARFALLCLGVWLNAADALVTATIMPSVAADIGGYAYFGWATAGYVLGAIVAGASAGLLSLQFGVRVAMAVGGATYTIGCIVGALAPDIGVFLLGRLMQGVGAGWIAGLCYVALGSLFPASLWPRILATASGVWGVATLLGPLIGGLFAEWGLWRGAFWIFAVQGLGFIAAALVLLGPARGAGSTERFPLGPLSVLTAGILCIAGAGLLSDTAQAIFAGSVGLLLLVLFVRLNARAVAPMLPRTSGDLRTAIGAGYAMIFALSAASVGYSVYGAAIMQAIYGVSPLVAGYVLGAEAMSWTVLALIVASLPQRWHGLFIRLGAATVLTGVCLLAVTMRHGPISLIVVSSAFLGGGFGLCWAFVAQSILGSVEGEERALASSAVPTMQLIGNATGAAGAGAIANFLGFSHGIDAETAAGGSFWLFAAFVPVALAGLAAAWRLASLGGDQMSLRADSSSFT
ncbi:MAG: MFS transporter [Parvibaculum sp.]|uniref:MFS transporter n=1 Tax=Parvibaculum sp. TaxID=2024848 RepID=UPI002841138B|nr:MFS transporter [Parvibaculum sp.]MDR3499027.1 MFS transporter [Parvibaculum sp.]